MDAYKLIDKIYKNNPEAKEILLIHSNQVKEKALKIAKDYYKKTNKKINLKLIKNGALLHDIGIIKVDIEKFNCNGNKKYIEHTYEGFKILMKNLYPRLALIALRHTGTGISKEEIIKHHLPLPHINMIPKSIEEEIICLADKFYSKSHLDKKNSEKKIRKKTKRFGFEAEKRLDYLFEKYL